MRAVLCVLALATVQGYDNGSPNSRLPVMGWSSWVALGPGAEHPIFDYCDEQNVKNAMVSAQCIQSSHLSRSVLSLTSVYRVPYLYPNY
jgi:hypothetical protein